MTKEGSEVWVAVSSPPPSLISPFFSVPVCAVSPLPKKAALKEGTAEGFASAEACGHSSLEISLSCSSKCVRVSLLPVLKAMVLYSSTLISHHFLSPCSSCSSPLSRPFFSCSCTLEWMLVSSAPPTPTFPHLPPPARSGFSSATSSSRKPRQLGQIPVLGSESPRAFPQRTENFILPFSPTPCSLWDLSSSTRDRTFTFSSESVAF